MEKKTMGSFIATLRKANGMTQKDLAEKLNVSDKAVSRWERDENAPDLSLIPVIAEIFDVTADELLRGERKNAEKNVNTENGSGQKYSSKTEKQLRYIINGSKNKYEIRSMFSIALVAIGLILALLFNFAFTRAEVGFFVATILYVIALFCEIIFYKLWDNSLKTNEFEDSQIDECRIEIIKFLEKVIAVIVVVFALTIPFYSIPASWYGGDSYIGIGMGEWLGAGALYAIIPLLVCTIIILLINKYLLNIDDCLINRIKVVAKSINKKMAAALLVVFIVVLLVESFLEMLDATDFVKGREFDNYKDFVTYMETKVEVYVDNEGNEVLVTEMTTAMPEEDIEYNENDEDTDVDSDEELCIVDIHNKKGELVVSFNHANEDVYTWQYKADEDCLPITTYTQADRIRGEQIRTWIMTAVGIFGIGVVAIVVAVTKKKCTKSR